MAWFSRAFYYIQRNSQIFASVGVALAVTASALPQTFGVWHYRKILARYDGLEEVPVDENTQSLIERCFQRLKLRAPVEANVSFFTTVYKDILHKGSANLRFGAIIGLPESYALQNQSDIDKARLQIDGQTIADWDSEAGKKLAESIVLSDRAKAFAIAREIKYATSMFVSFDYIMRTVMCVGAYTTGFYLNKNLRLQSVLTLWARGSVYSVVAGAWAVLYILLHDGYSCWTDNSVDREVAELTIAYAQGGVEYYTKLLQRNQALRVLQVGGANDKSKLYTIYGNEVETWRRSHVQISSRRDNIIKYLAVYSQQQQQQQNSSQETVDKDATKQTS